MVFAQFSEQHGGKFGEPRAVGGRQTAEVSEEGGAQVPFYPLARCWTSSETLSSVSLDVSTAPGRRAHLVGRCVDHTS